MKQVPNKPFLTEDFSPNGGGIDFLGLRWVNLGIVGSYLLPEINNVTRDMGVFCLAGWIPWKFAQLAVAKTDHTEKNYRQFRETIELAISYQLRDESLASQTYGTVRNRVGITQKLVLPGTLTFQNADRSRNNSVYAAAVYGPAVRYLGFVTSYYIVAEDRTPLHIPKASEDADALKIFTTIDKHLRQSRSYGSIVQLQSPTATTGDLDSLGRNGLHPTLYRRPEFTELKAAFRRKLLPENPEERGYARTKTARLILETLNQRNGLTTDDLRNIWYTGIFSGNQRMKSLTQESTDQRSNWALFMARQYQRHAVETLFECFEVALTNKCSTIDEIVDYWLTHPGTERGLWPHTFRDLLASVADAAGISTTGDEKSTSDIWNLRVGPDHDQFEKDDARQETMPCLAACLQLAKWYWRMHSRNTDPNNKAIMELGQSDRMSMSWLIAWLHDRRELRMREFLHEAFSILVFAQHMRVALSRFDGEVQRLRFMLGDRGIEATTGTRDTGKRGVLLMPDRLDSFTELLADADVLKLDANGRLFIGKTAKTILATA